MSIVYRKLTFKELVDPKMSLWASMCEVSTAL